MALRLEKIDLLSLAGLPAAEVEAFHFTSTWMKIFSQICAKCGLRQLAKEALPAMNLSLTSVFNKTCFQWE